MHFTKIVATIGPSSFESAIMAQLMEAGMDVARINFSHGNHELHERTITRLRSVAEELDHPLAILGDLQGPKLRVGHLPPEGYPLVVGKHVVLTAQPESGNGIPCQYDDLHDLVDRGDRILLDDGLLEVDVIETNDTEIIARVISGGILHANKGMNLPRADSRIPAISDKDKQDLAFAIAHRLDWIALSFVRSPDEVHELKHLIKRQAPSGQLPQVIAKIEKPEAVDQIERILQAADGIMVARGDLGIELPSEDVPVVQKQIIKLCNQAGKPVITATQMLDSMIRHPRPTRAEASDVANAVMDGSDAVMLSAETAAGKYPVRSVQTMKRIVQKAENAPIEHHSRPPIVARVNFAAQAIAHAAYELANDLGAAAIIAPTASGYTARQISRYRPNIPVIAVTPNPMVRRQLNLYSGVYPLFSPRRLSTDEVIADAVQVARDKGLVAEGDLVIITAGSAGSTPGTTNLIKLQLIESVLAEGQGLGATKVRGRIRKLQPPLSPGVNILEDDIVVAHAFDSSWQRLLTPACGIVAEEGSRQSEAARLSLELQIPAVVGATGAFRSLQEGDLVVLDPIRGLVYRGLSLDDRRSAEPRRPHNER